MNISVDSAGAQADLDSFTPMLSANGRFVAYTSFSDNLILGDLNEGSDVFVRDLQANTTERVSEYTGHYEGEGDSLRPSISADGRYVAFDSDDWNLVWGDTNDDFDVFVNDRATTATIRLSIDDSGTQSNGASNRPSISADGRYVAFYSEASNLVPGDTNGATDVFVHDQRSGATKRISVGSSGAEANGDSVRPALSANGRLAVFESDATNLVPGDTNGFTDIFLNDPQGTPPAPPAAGPVQGAARDRDEARRCAEEDRARELHGRPRSPRPSGFAARGQGARTEPEGGRGPGTRDQGRPHGRPALIVPG